MSVNDKVTKLHGYLNSKLDRCEWSATHPGRFNRGERLPRLDGTKSCFGLGEKKIIPSLVYQTSVMQLVVTN
jgi:hypothetical protein